LAGGVFIRTEDPFPIGKGIETLLTLGAGDGTSVKVVVVHIRHSSADSTDYPSGMSISFKEVSNDAREKSKNFIQGILS